MIYNKTEMISAVILSHNNQDTIGKAIDSVSFCDEVIVIDDGSTDDTVAIAKKRGAVVIQHELKDDFAAQRNFGLSKTKGEWVLFVDSDEIVSLSLREEILQVISNIKNKKSNIQIKYQKDTYNGYYLCRKDYMLGRELKYGETGHIKLLRLARKNSGTWERPIHEIWKVKGETGTLVSPLLHYPHPSVREFLSDINRYSTINARYFYDTGTRVSWWQIICYPTGKFVVNYIIKRGFLDGTAGIVVALLMSFHSFLTRGKIWELQHQNR